MPGLLRCRWLPELARGAGLQACIDWACVPVISGAHELAAQGCVTGASRRNWASYGAEVNLPAAFTEVDKALLSDPQTSGGLLVSCSAESVAEVLGIFHAQGFGEAAVIGEVAAGTGMVVR